MNIEDLLSALADKCEKRASEWSDTGMYRDRDMCDNIATMLSDLAKDLRALAVLEPPKIERTPEDVARFHADMQRIEQSRKPKGEPEP